MANFQNYTSNDSMDLERRRLFPTRAMVAFCLLGLPSLACGSSSGLKPDATTAPDHAAKADAGLGDDHSPSGTGGASGTDATIAPLDGRGLVVTCPELPCLAPMVDLVTSCKPSYSCTYQASGLNLAYCFDNGIKVDRSYGTGTTPSGRMTMAVKKDGVPCYSTEVAYVDAGVKLVVETYKDATGANILTLQSEGPTKTTVTCAGAVSFVVPPNSTCEEGIAALGGFLPASSCLHQTAGNCAF